jgi:hypothetical protein
LIDTASDTWDYVLRYVEKELETIDRSLENPKLSYEDTQFIRGRAHTLRRIMQLPETHLIGTLDSNPAFGLD